MLVPPQPGISSEAFTAKPILTAKSSASPTSSSNMPPHSSKAADKRPGLPSQSSPPSSRSQPQSQPPTWRCFPPWINYHEWALESDFLSQASGSFADNDDGDRAKAEQRSRYFQTQIELQEQAAKQYPYSNPNQRVEMTTYVLYCPNGRKVLLPSKDEVSTLRLCVRKEKEDVIGQPHSGIVDDDVESPPSVGEQFMYVPLMPSGPPRPIHVTAPEMLPIRELKRLSSHFQFLVTPPGSMPEVAKIIRQAGAETVISEPPAPEAPEAVEAAKGDKEDKEDKGDKGDAEPVVSPEATKAPELDPAEVAAYKKQVQALLPPLVKLVKGHLVAHVSRQICGRWFVRRAPSICIPLLWPANTNTAILSLPPTEGPSTPRQPKLQLQLLAIPSRLDVHVGSETGPTAPPPPELHEEFLGSGLTYFSLSKLNLLEVIFNPWKQRVYTTQGPDIAADERRLEIEGEERVERMGRMNRELEAGYKEMHEEKVRRWEEYKAKEEAKKRERREKGLPEDEEDDDEDENMTEDDDEYTFSHGINKGVKRRTGNVPARPGRPAKRPAPKPMSPPAPKRRAKIPSLIKPPLSRSYPSSSQTVSSLKATRSSTVLFRATKPRQQAKARQEVKAPPRLSPRIHPAVSEADQQMMHSPQYIPRPVHPEVYGHAPGPSNPLERLSPGLQQMEMPPQAVFTRTSPAQAQAQTQTVQQQQQPRTRVQFDANGNLPSFRTLLSEVEFLQSMHSPDSPDRSPSVPASPVSVSSTSSAALMPPPPPPPPPSQLPQGLQQSIRQGSVPVAVPVQQSLSPTVQHHYETHQQSHDRTRTRDGEQLGQRLRERHLTFEDRMHHINLRRNQLSRWPQV